MSLITSKAISQLLLPPGGPILLAILGLIYWRRSWGRGLIAISLLALWLLGTEPVRDGLLSPLENRYPALQMKDIPAENKSASTLAIVLLGGGVYEMAPEYGGRDMLGNASLKRTVYAADLSMDTGLNIFTTGGAIDPESTEPEGLVMQRLLHRLGIAKDRIYAETVAMNTWENAAYLKLLLQKKGVEQVVLVTTAWHMPRSVWVFEAHGIRVIPAPCDYKTKQRIYDLRSFLPNWKVFSDSSDALHEYLGLLWYRLRYSADT